MNTLLTPPEGRRRPPDEHQITQRQTRALPDTAAARAQKAISSSSRTRSSHPERMALLTVPLDKEQTWSKM